MTCLALVLAACGPPEPPGTWLAGDLHLHSSVGSNDTDGLGTPDALAPAMARAGLDFLFLTDHSNATGSMHCSDVEDCPNLGPEWTDPGWPAGVYAGSEISPIASLEPTLEPTGHVGCLEPGGFARLDHFEDRPPGEITGGEAAAQCRAAGGWVVINHPFAAAGWVAYDWTSEDFDAIEVYNGGGRFDAWDAEGVAAWEERVAGGRDVVPVGGSDCHRWGTAPPGTLLDPALGWPATLVNVRDGERPLDGLRAGRVVVAEPGTGLTVVARRGAQVAGPGETIDGPVDLEVRATAAEDGLRLEVVQAGVGPIASEALPAEIAVEVGAGAWYARVWPQGEVQADHGGVALSNAIRVR